MEAGSDTVPYEPVKSYMICAIPRTGSYLLCDVLRATGVAGNPNEYFSDSYQRPWSARWGTSDYESYLRRVIGIGTTANQVMGVKTHPWQFNHFARQAAGRAPVPYIERPAILEKWFPDLHYVWLRRRDRLRQAISYARSLQTNIWWDADIEPVPNATPKPEALEFDFELITQSVARLVEEEDMWRRYFSITEIEPLVVYYEDLLVDSGAAVRSVMAELHIPHASAQVTPDPGFRRQADAITESWVEKYRAELARGPYAIWRGERLRPAGAAKVPPGDRSAGHSKLSAAVALSPENADVDLESVLSSRRWLRCDSPFPYIRATDVFEPDTYRAMTSQYEALFNGGRFSRGIPGYDVTAYTVTSKTKGPLSILASRPWHDMIARLMGVEATGEVNVALHHHAVGSESGAPHNDLNPGWFADLRDSEGLVVHDPADGCDYRFGKADGDVETVERMRAVAIIFYLANPVRAVSGGQTGLYRSTSDPIDRPSAVVPPVNNSLVAFECTPSSFHGFISNRTTVRNCLVMWLHRDKNEVLRRWGESSIVYWRR